MPTILAIDVGTVRVGCAIANEGVQMAFPVGIWPRAKGEAEKQLLTTLREKKPSKLIVGLPLGPNGERTTMCENIENFVRRVIRREVIEVVYVDESFSSIEAMESQVQETGKGRSEPVDAIAACVILERYLTGVR